MNKHEKNLMLAGLEVKGFRKIFEAGDPNVNFSVEVWKGGKHINIFFNGEKISHYFYQIKDVKAQKRILAKEIPKELLASNRVKIFCELMSVDFDAKC
jgi:hypothetical protein